MNSNASPLGNYLAEPPDEDAQAWAAARGKPMLPLWTRTFSDAGTTYSYTMVGTDPAAGSSSTTIPVLIVPFKFTMPDGSVFDATMRTQTLKISAVQAFVSSPLFEPVPFRSGKVWAGDTQYLDAFQRANFWSDVSRRSPGYHVLLGVPRTIKPIVLTIPDGLGRTHVLRNGIKWASISQVVAVKAVRDYLKHSQQVEPDRFVVFLSYNTVIGRGVAYHSSLGPQTFAVTVFNDRGVLSFIGPQFEGVANVEVSTHEIGEWLDDPFGENQTPAGLLEAGDPLDGSHEMVRSDGREYNVQELAFHDYFTCKRPPSTSANGWYSFLGTFLTPSNDC